MKFILSSMLVIITLNAQNLTNKTPSIPSQCYTKTQISPTQTHNPCYACHTKGVEPNFNDDSDFQTDLAFRESAKKNPWTNLFHPPRIDPHLSDKKLLNYIRTSNYQNKERLYLADKLKHPPKAWDLNHNGRWDGYTPDCYYHFDEEGFDHNPQGTITGWRAFRYYPFVGTFWPTNGSTDDVLIRLDKIFWQNSAGKIDLAVYKLNLAIVEAMIKRQSITIPATDEKLYGVDLDHNGFLGEAHTIFYEWDPLHGKNMSYVGLARKALLQGQIHLAAGLFPEGTEFLHSVRYIDYDDQQRVRLSARFKELRYAKKTHWIQYSDLMLLTQGATRNKATDPDQTELSHGDFEKGILLGNAWKYQGFIEDRRGALRPQTYEEHLFCVGCHSTLGATTDSTFSFGRKLSHPTQGWQHWSQRGYDKEHEPQLKNGEGEYSAYLKHNKAGDEFRMNREVIEKFFDTEGKPQQKMFQELSEDIGTLLSPSYDRGLHLNKCYHALVKQQTFQKGRDPLCEDASPYVHQIITSPSTGIKEKILP